MSEIDRRLKTVDGPLEVQVRRLERIDANYFRHGHNIKEDILTRTREGYDILCIY